MNDYKKYIPTGRDQDLAQPIAGRLVIYSVMAFLIWLWYTKAPDYMKERMVSDMLIYTKWFCICVGILIAGIVAWYGLVWLVALCLKAYRLNKKPIGQVESTTEAAPIPAGRTHELKCHPEYFEAILDDSKRFEVRVFDREYAVGDYLRLKEFDPVTTKYTGRCTTRQITYILHGGKFGIADGYAVMSIARKTSTPIQ